MAASLRTDGIEIAYSLQGPPGAKVILFVNGLGMDMSMWAPQVEHFAGEYQILRYDLRGHGRTPATPGDYSLDILADDAAALLDALNIRSVHLVGTSLGAMIGMQLALTRPERLSSLVLCATTATAPQDRWRERIETARREGLASQLGPVVDRWFTPGLQAARPDVMQRMRDMVLATSVAGYAGCAAAIRDMELADRLGRIGVRTVVIAGEDDLATPLSDEMFIADGIPGARLVRVPDAAHMPTIEQPDRCNAAIADFLREGAAP